MAKCLGFNKSAVSDPWLNSEEDIDSALQHVLVNFNLNYPLLSLDLFIQEKVECFDYKPLYEGTGWSESWSFGEFRAMDSSEIYEELSSFRGENWTRTLEYLEEGESFPAIVVVMGFPKERLSELSSDNMSEATYYEEIADGRGRCALAYAFGIECLPAIILKAKNPVSGGF
jgi:hypothetical protein